MLKSRRKSMQVDHCHYLRVNSLNLDILFFSYVFLLERAELCPVLLKSSHLSPKRLLPRVIDGNHNSCTSSKSSTSTTKAPSIIVLD